MSWIYRCSSCRTRNTFTKALRDYKRGKKCRHCGYARFYPDKERTNRKGCTCGGYSFPHRTGSGSCLHNKHHLYNQAKRQGASKEDLAMIQALHGSPPSADQTCPF